ncbi:MAG TPA: zinc ribbon domain-containing protein [Terriglobales bacterium]|nr:zinc ribbon domain-containing protein [Terriglobales bacterium]
MAFCNSCGATLTPGTKFCNKCGSAVSGPPTSAAPSNLPAPPPPSTGSSSALKIILIVIAVIVVVGILGLATLSFVAHRFIAHNVHGSQDGKHVKVETPFGSAETSNDPAQTAKDLGIEIYPGAQVQRNGATTATFGGMHTVAASFESGDSVDKICTFYKAKFPNAMVTTSGTNRCTLISSDQKNMISINIESSGDSTKFQISNVTKSSTSSN